MDCIINIFLENALNNLGSVCKYLFVCACSQVTFFVFIPSICKCAYLCVVYSCIFDYALVRQSRTVVKTAVYDLCVPWNPALYRHIVTKAF